MLKNKRDRQQACRLGVPLWVQFEGYMYIW